MFPNQGIPGFGMPLASGSAVSRTDFTPYLQMQQMGEQARQFNSEQAFRVLDQKLKAGQFQQSQAQQQGQFDASRNDQNQRDTMLMRDRAYEQGQARLDRETAAKDLKDQHEQERQDLAAKQEVERLRYEDAKKRQDAADKLAQAEEARRVEEEKRYKEQFDYDKKIADQKLADAEKARADKVKYAPQAAAGAKEARMWRASQPKWEWATTETALQNQAARLYPNDTEAQNAFVEAGRQTWAQTEKDKEIGAPERASKRAAIDREINDLSDDLMKYEKFAGDYQGTAQGADYAKQVISLRAQLAAARKRRSELD